MSDRERPLGRVVQFDGYGGSDTLEVRMVPRPVPGPEEVLVRVHASGLNPKDVMIRSGALRLQTGRAFPRGTGFDFAGEVVATGAGVVDPAPGTHVWGFLDGVMGGAAADYVVVPRGWLAPVPERLGWIEAAALPLVGSAALQALRDVAMLEAGEKVLIRGASGGVGSAAIQIARAMGAHVTAITSSGGLAHCRALGAHEAVDRATSDPAGLGRRFHVFLDCVGGSSLRGFRRLLVRGGRWVTVAPSLPVFALTPVSRLIGPLLPLPRFGFVVVRPVASDLADLGRLVEAGELRMPVAATYPLEQVRAAHDAMGGTPARGKGVLTVSSEAASDQPRSAATEVGHAGAA